MNTANHKWSPIGTHAVRPALEHEIKLHFGKIEDLSDFIGSITEMREDCFLVELVSGYGDRGYIFADCLAHAMHYAKKYEREIEKISHFDEQSARYGFYWEARN